MTGTEILDYLFEQRGRKPWATRKEKVASIKREFDRRRIPCHKAIEFEHGCATCGEEGRCPGWHADTERNVYESEISEQPPLGFFAEILELEATTAAQLDAERVKRENQRKIAERSARTFGGTFGDVTPDMFGQGQVPLLSKEWETTGVTTQ